jgi:long-chain acyl-CoA synthetase
MAVRELSSDEERSFTLTDADNAAAILFRQAALPERRERPRLMVDAGGGWRPVSWGELAMRARRLAAFLVDRGVSIDDKVAVLSATRLEWCIAGIAALATRGVLVPVDPMLTAAALGHVLAHSDAKVLLVEDAPLLARVRPLLAETAIHTIVCFEAIDGERGGRRAEQAVAHGEAPPVELLSLEAAEASGAAVLERDPACVVERTAAIRLDDVGYLLYTSGRGVPLTHRNLGVNGAAWVEVNGPLCHDDDRDLLWLPMSQLFGWGEFCLGNQLGFRSYLSDPVSVLRHLPEVRPHILMSVPACWDKLAELARAAARGREADQIAELRRLTGGRLYFCLSGGAGLRREVKELFLRAGMLLVEGYGLTECAPTLTMNRYNDFDFSTVGKPIAGVQLKLAPDGEILARGPNVFAGYYKDPQATRAAFDDDGWFHTGDVGRFTKGGFLRIVDRIRHLSARGA